MQCVRSGANELCSHKTLVMVDCSAAYAAVANEVGSLVKLYYKYSVVITDSNFILI